MTNAEKRIAPPLYTFIFRMGRTTGRRIEVKNKAARESDRSLNWTINEAMEKYVEREIDAKESK